MAAYYIQNQKDLNEANMLKRHLIFMRSGIIRAEVENETDGCI